MQRHVQVEGVREALRGQKVVMVLPVVVRLVVVEARHAALLILAAAVVSAIGAETGRVDAVPRLIAHLATAEGLELEHRAAVVVSRRSVIRAHVRPRTLDVAVRLHVGITGIEDEMVADESRSAAHGVRKGAIATRRRRGLEVRLQPWALRLHGHRGAEGRGTVRRRACAALDLYRLDRRGEVGHVDPENAVALRVIHRHTVNRKVDAPRIRATHPHGDVAHAVATVRSDDHRGRLREEVGQRLARVVLAQLSRRDVAEGHRRLSLGLHGRDYDLVQFIHIRRVHDRLLRRDRHSAGNDQQSGHYIENLPHLIVSIKMGSDLRCTKKR